jgi:hypothetical protein
MKDAIGWAVVGSNGLLWDNTCKTSNAADYLRIFDSEVAAKAHTVLPDDVVVEVVIREKV